MLLSGYFYKTPHTTPAIPITIIIMPVIWLMIFKPLMFSLFLKWLTINVSVLHHKNAPDNIDIIAIGYSNAD